MHPYPPSYKLYESRPLPPLPLGATPSPSASPPPRHMRTPSYPPFSPVSPTRTSTSSPSPSSSASSAHSSPRPRPGLLRPTSHYPPRTMTPQPAFPSPYTPSLYALRSSMSTPDLVSSSSFLSSSSLSLSSTASAAAARRRRVRVSRPPSSLCLPLAPLPESDVVDTAQRACALLAHTHGLEDELSAVEVRACARRRSVRAIECDMAARAVRREAVLAAAWAALSA